MRKAVCRRLVAISDPMTCSLRAILAQLGSGSRRVMPNTETNSRGLNPCGKGLAQFGRELRGGLSSGEVKFVFDLRARRGSRG